MGGRKQGVAEGERGCEPKRGKKMEMEIGSAVFGKEADIVLIVSGIIHSNELKG